MKGVPGMSSVKNNNNGFVKDRMRESYLNAVRNRIVRGKSSLIAGEFGCGKTEFLRNIKPSGRRVVWCESTSSPYQMLPDILRQSGKNVKASFIRTPQYLRMICEMPDSVLMIDEANDLKNTVFPYLKRFMNAGIPIVMAGRTDDYTDIEAMLGGRYQDILSRFRVLRLKSLSVEELKKSLTDFDPDAAELIYGASNGNLRVFYDHVEDCREKLTETGEKRVSAEIAMSFVGLPD
jgi:hypothetical protein